MRCSPKPLRVVLLVPRFPLGVQPFIAAKFEGLRAKGLDVHIVCEKSATGARRAFPHLEHACVHVTRPLWRRLLRPVLWPWLLARCLGKNPAGTRRYLIYAWHRWRWKALRHFVNDAEIIALAPDVVHCEFGFYARRFVFLKETLGCRFTTSFRGSDICYDGLDDPDYYRQVWERADAIHCNGNVLYQRALARGCPPQMPHAIITAAVNAEAFAPSTPELGARATDERIGTPERPLRILSVGRLVWKKGHEYALQAVRLLLDEGVVCQLRVIGGGPSEESVRFTRHDLGLRDAVELWGERSHAEVSAALQWADAFLLASVSEGFSNAMLEAQAAGVPVVCSDCEGARDNIADGQTGFVVPKRDPRALADKLKLLAGDATLRRGMGEAGQRRAREEFCLERQIDAWLEFYTQFAPASCDAVPNKP